MERRCSNEYGASGKPIKFSPCPQAPTNRPASQGLPYQLTPRATLQEHLVVTNLSSRKKLTFLGFLSEGTCLRKALSWMDIVPQLYHKLRA